MNEQEWADILLHGREFSALSLNIRTATHKAEARAFHEWEGISEEKFAEIFPSLEKIILDLPDEPPPA
ncbi:hypothetical protein ACFXAZ_00950 [Streptomyces sp. NPDC059477]|uniref:hypothetical protein n=1 Tax=Streptomyces sp. NPDC059477 TaxID=3346847 RepID=UPI0036A208C9